MQTKEGEKIDKSIRTAQWLFGLLSFVSFLISVKFPAVSSNEWLLVALCCSSIVGFCVLMINALRLRQKWTFVALFGIAGLLSVCMIWVLVEALLEEMNEHHGNFSEALPVWAFLSLFYGFFTLAPAWIFYRAGRAITDFHKMSAELVSGTSPLRSHPHWWVNTLEMNLPPETVLKAIPIKEPVRKYFVWINNETQGPYSPEELKTLRVAGEILPDTLCVREGQENWVTLKEVWCEIEGQ